MRLSEKEGAVLACSHLRAGMSIDDIREATGFRDHTIRYALKRLIERQMIRKYPFINLGSLGFTLYNIFFSVGATKRDQVSKLLRSLSERSQVLWMAEVGGDYQYALEVSAMHISEVRSLLRELSEEFGNIFFQKTVSAQFSVSLLPRGYLSGENFGLKPLRAEVAPEPESIDELDSRILQIMVANGDLSHRKLAQKLGVPLSTFELRVKKLKEKKILAGYFYGINVSLLGYESFKLLVFGRGISSRLSENLLRFATKHPNMTMFFETFGSWDYEIGVEVENARQVVRICQELYDEFGTEIQDIKVLPKFADLKVRLFPSED